MKTAGIALWLLLAVGSRGEETNAPMPAASDTNAPAAETEPQGRLLGQKFRDYTIVMFGHRKWREEVEFMGHCSTKWATYLLSLRDLVETGKGKPAPNDLMISNWH